MIENKRCLKKCCKVNFNTIIEVSPLRDFTPKVEYTSKKYDFNYNIKSSFERIFNWKIISNGVREPIVFRFAFEKPPGFDTFCEPKTLHYEKQRKL